MIYTLKINISSLDKSFSYENKLKYTKLFHMKHILDKLEDIYSKLDIEYQLPSHMYEFIYNEDTYLTYSSSFSITAIVYKFNYNGWLFVGVKKGYDKIPWIRYV